MLFLAYLCVNFQCINWLNLIILLHCLEVARIRAENERLAQELKVIDLKMAVYYIFSARFRGNHTPVSSGSDLPARFMPHICILCQLSKLSERSLALERISAPSSKRNSRKNERYFDKSNNKKKLLFS